MVGQNLYFDQKSKIIQIFKQVSEHVSYFIFMFLWKLVVC